MIEYTTYNPFNSQELDSFLYLSDQELKDKVSVSKNAFLRWRKLTLKERITFISKVGTVLESRLNDDAEWMSEEMGKPILQSKVEIRKCIWLCDFYAQNAISFLENKIIKTDASESFVTYNPLGIILGIMPWNFPFWQVIRFVVPTLLAGNVVMIKHAPNTFGSSLRLQSIFEEAGMPKGVYQNLLLDIDQTTSLIKNSEIKGVSLTGSTLAGQKVGKLCGELLKPKVLELGGSNGFLVFSDADIEEVVKIAISARFQNNGQSCIAAKRFIVHHQIYQEFIELLYLEVAKLKMGNPLDANIEIGPLARKDLADHLNDQVRESIKRGAKLILGGKQDNCFYSPSILTDVKPGMPAFDDELFGPVVAVCSAESENEMIELSNKSSFGLGVSLFSKDIDKLKRFLPYLDEGAIFINEMVKSDPRLPFGGIKNSGLGRELSEEGIKQFVNIKTVYIK